MMALQTAGSILGPMVTGFLFDTVGYWLTLIAPLGILLVDLIARVLMVEVGRGCKQVSADAGMETTALVSGTGTGTGPGYDLIGNAHDGDRAEHESLLAFYRVILSDGEFSLLSPYRPWRCFS